MTLPIPDLASPEICIICNHKGLASLLLPCLSYSPPSCSSSQSYTALLPHVMHHLSLPPGSQGCPINSADLFTSTAGSLFISSYFKNSIDFQFFNLFFNWSLLIFLLLRRNMRRGSQHQF